MNTRIDDLLGRLVTLRVRHLGRMGASLTLAAPAEGPNPLVIRLPRNEVGEGTKQGDDLEVFVYLDIEDRPVATTQAPRLLRDQVAFLTVTGVTRSGALVDWGLDPELIVQDVEQTRDLRVGERHPIGLMVDDAGRLAGTMRVSEMLEAGGPSHVGDWVEGEAWRKEPELGVFVILERRFVGLVPAHEPTTLARGQAARFRVATVLPDGKLEFSLRGHAHEEVDSDAGRVLDTLSRPGVPRVGDRSSPEQIRALFGLSKKAFKRAAGQLLKQRKIDIDDQGFLVLQHGPGPSDRRRPGRS